MFRIFAYTLIACALLFTNAKAAKCFIQEDPLDILDCLTISPNIIVSFANDQQVKEFCKMAVNYMNCMTLYVRDCPAGYTGAGALNDLIDLTNKCCITDKSYINQTDPLTNQTKLVQTNDQCLISSN